MAKEPAEGIGLLFSVLVNTWDPQPLRPPRQDHQDPPDSSRTERCRLTEHHSARSGYFPCESENLLCQSVLEQSSDSPKPPFLPEANFI